MPYKLLFKRKKLLAQKTVTVCDGFFIVRTKYYLQITSYKIKETELLHSNLSEKINFYFVP